jgi:hypothetical protein
MDESGWNTAGMILTAVKRGAVRKNCPTATLPTKNLAWTNPALNPGLFVEVQRLTAEQ